MSSTATQLSIHTPAALARASFSKFNNLQLSGGEALSSLCEEFSNFVARQGDVLVSEFGQRLAMQTGYAVLGGEHQLILGLPGRGKTKYGDAFLSQFRDCDCSVFSTQLTRTSTEGALLGHPIASEFMRGRIILNTAGQLSACEMSFIDELFDANDNTLRAGLLSVLNERKIRRGAQIEDAKTHSVVCASNSLRVNEETAALVDRLIFKARAPDKMEAFDAFQLGLAGQSVHVNTSSAEQDLKMPFAHLKALAQIVAGNDPKIKIVIPPHILVLHNFLLNSFAEGFREAHNDGHALLGVKASQVSVLLGSPRAHAKQLKVLKSAALLSNRLDVGTQDLAELQYVIPILGVKEDEAIFDRALNTTIAAFTSSECEAIDTWGYCLTSARALALGFTSKDEIKRPLWEKLLIAIHWTKPKDPTLEDLIDTARSIKARREPLISIRDGVIEKIAELMHNAQAKTSA